MIKKTSFILILLCLFSINIFSQKKNTSIIKGKKPIYLQLYSVRDDIRKDFKSTITAVAKAGYTGIEAAGYKDEKFYGLSPNEFKKAINSVGMEVLSSHTGISLAKDVQKTDWDAVWKWWDMAIAAHKAAGMKYIVKPSMPVPKTLADLKVYCDYYNKVGEKCNDAGLKFGYHNHAFEFEKIEGELMYDFMLKNTDPTKVFFQMDVYWTVIGKKGPVDYFNEYPGRFEMLHIKDNKELGQSGMVGFDAIFKNTAKAGAKYMVVEVERYNYEPLESIKLSYDYLKSNPYFKVGKNRCSK
ncbi:MAG: sugar phosphate isomerase/epimerase [Bacteroidales bacterium]|nr:sugar phosphate isomerase/epimerase [Bacteroidales bacterium]